MNTAKGKYLFTSESVAEGHPDKICDQISDSILDEFLKHAPNARVACEVMAVPNNIILGGEITADYTPSAQYLEDLVRNKLKEIGCEQDLFHWQKINILNFIHKQSPDIALGVNKKNPEEEGAGDQGIMFGYACSETPSLMPAPIFYANRILESISTAREAGKLDGLYADAKTQITLEYNNEGVPIRATDIILSIHHHQDLTQSQIKDKVYHYIKSSLPNGWMCDYDRLLVNPTGRFCIGGPVSDAGLTGRKIIVDTYGGAAPHGGGAFSGKDPSKVDRSAAYATRYLAKNIVASGLAQKCLIQVAYAIGIAQPISIHVNTFGTSHIKDTVIASKIPEIISLRPHKIRTHLKLDKPIYHKTSVFGHFGRIPDKEGYFSWENIDLTEKILSIF